VAIFPSESTAVVFTPSLNFFTVGLSFVNSAVINFDRHYALSKHFAYATNETKQG